MYRAFAHFDTDNSGYITVDELEAAGRCAALSLHRPSLCGQGATPEPRAPRRR